MRRAVSAIGFHGTDKSGSEGILREGFKISRNKYDWLGEGVYFFQDAPVRARKWVEQRDDPAVIGVVINLDGCMDFLDISWYDTLARVFKEYKIACQKNGVTMPLQKAGNHKRDKIVLDLTVKALEKNNFHIRTVRAIFKEGARVYPRSAFNTLDHVQIAIRDTAAIEDLWVE